MWSISRAAPEDAPVIVALQRRAFAEEGRLCDDWTIPPLTETVEAIELHVRTQTAVVARAGGAVVGAARGIRDGTVCTIRGVCVEPSRHGQGIGAALLATIEQLHPGVERFQLTTNPSVPGNVQFYERRGYRVDELTLYAGTRWLAQMSKAGGAAKT